MLKRLLFFSVLLALAIPLILIPTSVGQNSNKPTNTNSAPVLKIPQALDPAKGFPAKWTFSSTPVAELKVGDIVTFKFTGTPVADHRLYSSSLTTEKGDTVFNKVTVFNLVRKESKGVQLVGKLIESVHPHDAYDDIIEVWERKFDNAQTVVFSQKVKITDASFQLTGLFTFQVCNDGACKFGDLEVTWKGTAKGDGLVGVIDTVDPTPVPIDSEIVIDTVPNGGVEKGLEGKTLLTDTGLPCAICEGKWGQTEATCEMSILFSIFLQAFVFGLFAIFTPCVFPIIPLNVSFFTKQSKTRQQGIRNGLIYAGFIIFIYVVLGLSLSVAFGPNVLYNFSTHYITNLIFFALLVVFAMSFFGWFEITLPSSWSTKLDAQSDRGGMLGIFFMALTLVVVSFSCTGPLVGSVLIAASGQGGGCMMMPVAGMFGFSLALSIPFALLSIFPGYMNQLPKSGGWLNSVKVVLGFIELAMALKFLSAADLVMEWHILDREIFLAIWIVLFILCGVYLLGKIQLPHDSPTNSIGVPRLMIAILSFCFAAILLPAMFGKSITILEGVIPPITKDTGVNVRGGVARPQCDEFTLNGKICAIEDRKFLEYFRSIEVEYAWFYDLCEAMEFAKKEKRPLFVDFTGHTCANCRKMEQTVFPNSEIEHFLKNEYVIVSLWVDDDNPLDDVITLSDGTKLRKIGQLWLNLENKWLENSAQPYYVLADYNSEILVAPIGFTPDKNKYKEFLQSGLDEFKKRHPELAKSPATH
jgi:cytochrome c biogenesis protein CcdA/thioredoxin-related protein